MIKDYQLFNEKINYVIQNSGLDIGVVYFIIKDIFSNIEKTYYTQINKEILEEEKEKSSDSEKNKSK